MFKNLKQKNKENIFVWLVLALPLLQFLLFYVYVNFEQILMTMQEWVVDDAGMGSYRFLGNGIFGNFSKAFNDLSQDVFLSAAFSNSVIACFISLIAGSTLALVFSSYLAHKRLGSKFFKIILFMPNIVSMGVLANIFIGMNDRMIPELWKVLTGQTVDTGWLIKDSQTQFWVVLAFSLFFSFGVQVLSYSGTISGISESITEAAKLDGCGKVREFVSITVPMIWPTIVTFVTITLAGFFTNQLNLVMFFGMSGETQVYTYGYYMFVNMEAAVHGNEALMPGLATLGVIFSLISIPIIFTVRWAMNKFGPSAE